MKAGHSPHMNGCLRKPAGVFWLVLFFMCPLSGLAQNDLSIGSGFASAKISDRQINYYSYESISPVLFGAYNWQKERWIVRGSFNYTRGNSALYGSSADYYRSNNLLWSATSFHLGALYQMSPHTSRFQFWVGFRNEGWKMKLRQNYENLLISSGKYRQRTYCSRPIAVGPVLSTQMTFFQRHTLQLETYTALVSIYDRSADSYALYQQQKTDQDWQVASLLQFSSSSITLAYQWHFSGHFALEVQYLWQKMQLSDEPQLCFRNDQLGLAINYLWP